eukprot:gene23811-28869_t
MSAEQTDEVLEPSTATVGGSRLTPGAERPNTLDNRATAQKAFEKFRVARGYTQPWDKLPENVICDRKLYEQLAKYLIQEHKQMVKDVDDNGEEIQVQAHIKCSTAIIYFNIMLQLALGKYGERGTEKSKSFLTCVDRNSTSDSAKWLRGMRKKINQVCFERSIAMGENLDGSPTPIYLCHVRLAVRQYAK